MQIGKYTFGSDAIVTEKDQMTGQMNALTVTQDCLTLRIEDQPLANQFISGLAAKAFELSTKVSHVMFELTAKSVAARRLLCGIEKVEEFEKNLAEEQPKMADVEEFAQKVGYEGVDGERLDQSHAQLVEGLGRKFLGAENNKGYTSPGFAIHEIIVSVQYFRSGEREASGREVKIDVSSYSKP